MPISIVLLLSNFLSSTASGQMLQLSIPWVPSLEIEISLVMDGLSMLFALLISGIGALIAIYAGGYLADHPQLNRFNLYLLSFMLAMLGVVLTDNLITLFIFWELTSITSYFLIGFDHEKEEARKAALQALLVTGLGGLAMLAGLLILGEIGGTLEISELVANGVLIRRSPLYVPALLLILAGAFTKSAQFPFHFWLPNAMAAPTPASAYLHAATMVKAGVYLLARMNPILGGTTWWFALLSLFGGTTMLVGALVGIRQTVFKRILAFSTVSGLGTLVMLIGLGTDQAVQAAMLFLVAHALYKGALFLVAGIVDHQTGKKDILQVGGLAGALPMTAMAAGLAALSMGGIPPLFGFIAKEALYESALHMGYFAIPAVVAVVTTGILYLGMGLLVGVGPFLGARPSELGRVREAHWSMWMPPLVLAGTSLLFGVRSGLIEHTLLSPAMKSIVGYRFPTHLGLWHGFSFALVLSLFSMAMGVYVYLRIEDIRRAFRPFDEIVHEFTGANYDRCMTNLMAFARWQTDLLQSGYLKNYLLIIFASTISLTTYTLVSRAGSFSLPFDLPPVLHEVILVAVILAATVSAVFQKSRLGAIATLGIVGYGVALIFATFGAPDLAMTQLLIETLTVILFVLVLYSLPGFTRLSSKGHRFRDAVISIMFGALMTTLVIAALDVQFSPSISAEMARKSYPEAHGRNVVNVILVDFRGIDTMGEITVLSLAALGVFALMKLRPEKEEEV